jgi:preprotein translocase subunit Sec63
VESPYARVKETLVLWSCITSGGKAMKYQSELEQVKKCLRDKDKRITRIEGWFRIRNFIILLVGWFFLCFSWVIYLFLIAKRQDTIQIYTDITLVIGVSTEVIGTFIICIYGLIKLGDYLFKE